MQNFLRPLEVLPGNHFLFLGIPEGNPEGTPGHYQKK